MRFAPGLTTVLAGTGLMYISALMVGGLMYSIMGLLLAMMGFVLVVQAIATI